MSEEMARKKAQEIEALRTQDMAREKELQDDKCPCCGLATKDIPFFNVQIIKMFGWVECTQCGNVYCPKSILRQKGAMSMAGSAGIAPEKGVPSFLQPS